MSHIRQHGRVQASHLEHSWNMYCSRRTLLNVARMAAKITSATNWLDISADLRKCHPQFHTCCGPVFKRRRVVCKESVEFVHLAARGELRIGACAELECAAATEYRPGPAMQTTGLRNVCQNPGLFQFSLPRESYF